MEPNLSLAKDAISLIGLFKKGLTKTRNELIHLFELGLEDYLITQVQKHIEINTFFHQENKINFYEVYYKLKVFNEARKYTVDFESPINNLKNDRYVAIIGSAGSGKSMLTKFTYLQTIQEGRKIPILLEFRLLDSLKISLENYIYNQLLGKGVKPSQDTLKKSLKDGVYLFILDGYDEIYSKNIQVIINQIEDFVDKYKDNHFLITSRPGAGAERLPRFKPYYMKELEKFEIVEFVNKIITNIERRERMLTSVRNPDNSNYLNYLSNPLLLSMFLLTFQKFPEIPKRKSDFYHNVFDTLYSKHDGITKNSYIRERRSGLDKRALEYLLSIISYQFFLIGSYEFPEDGLMNILQKVRHKDNEISFDDDKVMYDLTTTLSILTRDGLCFTFPHRSLQEYFTAIFIHSFINDEKQKEKIYSRMIDTLFMSSMDSFHNFWDICREIDKTGFYKAFIINYLKRIKNMFQSNNEEKNMITLFSITQTSIKIKRRAKARMSKAVENMRSRKKVHKVSKSLLKFYININSNGYGKYSSFLSYLEIDKQFAWFNNFINSKEFKDGLSLKLTQLENNGQSRFYIEDETDLDLDKLYIKTCLFEVFKEQKFNNRLKQASNIIDNKILEISDLINTNIIVNDSLSNPFI